MMSRLFLVALVALLAVLGVVSGFAPVANTASVVGESSVPEEGEREKEAGTELMVETVRPSFIEMEKERKERK